MHIVRTYRPCQLETEAMEAVTEENASGTVEGRASTLPKQDM